MANSNFIVQNGLTVGPLTIDAATGSISTTGTVNITGGLATSTISKNDSSITINDTGTGSNIVLAVDGLTESTLTTTELTLAGNLVVNQTGYLKVPVGTNAQRPGSAANGMMRYNSDITSFEGYYAGAWSSLGGVKSVDGKAYITAEASAGAGDDVLRMYSGSTGSSVQVAWASASNVSILPTTAATSTSTGALQVAGGASVQKDLWVGGNIYANTLVSTTTSQLTVQDPMVYFTPSSPYPWTYDTGLYSDSIGGPANVYAHHGMVRNYAASEWTFFSNVKSEPGSTINWSDAGIMYDTIKVGNIVPGGNLTYNIGTSSAWFNTFYGVSTQAKYADLAENYQADKAYAPGTVVMFGGVQEVTLADADTTAVAGVVSTNPAHLMNGGLTGSNVVPLALQGRVPCNVIGPVKKGDLMVSAGFGFAKSDNSAAVGSVIGKALQEVSFAGKAVIEVVVGRV